MKSEDQQLVLISYWFQAFVFDLKTNNVSSETFSFYSSK